MSSKVTVNINFLKGFYTLFSEYLFEKTLIFFKVVDPGFSSTTSETEFISIICFSLGHKEVIFRSVVNVVKPWNHCDNSANDQRHDK